MRRIEKIDMPHLRVPPPTKRETSQIFVVPEKRFAGSSLFEKP